MKRGKHALSTTSKELHESDPLTEQNQRILTLSGVSAGEPCFLNRTDILFMSNEKIIMCYDFEKKEEVFTFT